MAGSKIKKNIRIVRAKRAKRALMHSSEHLCLELRQKLSVEIKNLTLCHFVSFAIIHS